MWDCGYNGNYWCQYALQCLPEDIWREWQAKMAFVSLSGSDGRRLTHSFREKRDIIILSERIVPKNGTDESSPEVRYFVFVVLHEVAHAICRHRPPNEISPEENAAQEAEADRLAFRWFNEFLRERNHPDLPEFTEEELKRAQAANQAAMKVALGLPSAAI